MAQTGDDPIGDELAVPGDELYPRRMVGPLLLTREAESLRRSLAEWVSAYRSRGEDYALDEYGNRVYEVSKLPPLVTHLLEIMGLQGRRYKMFRTSISKLVSTSRASSLIPIHILSGVPEIINLRDGVEPLLLGYYYILYMDIVISPEVDFLVVGERTGEQTNRFHASGALAGGS